MKSSLFWLTLVTVIWILNADQKKSVVPPETLETQKKIPPQTTGSNSVVEVALRHLGKPYVYGKYGPDSFDCSGFVYGTHRQLGIPLPRTSLNQSQIKGEKISRDDLQKGDLLFFDTSGRGVINHSGIYLGNGEFIHASSGKANSVTISSLDAWYKDKFKWGKRLNATK
ncbi:MAG TPA: peptidoglycan endopeptidase [Campylobacterales bacterium]|nr:peptidoglycan endopeptidase [Campylobacterales bacterium]